MGAIWLANTSEVSERTKHADIRAHFVRPYVMDQVVTIDFVKSAENTSDIMTKNQQGIYFESAQPKLVYIVQDIEKRDQWTGRMLESSILSCMFNNLKGEVALDWLIL